MKLITTIALACVAASTEWAAAEPPVAQPPNIVFLLADDLGWTGLRCFGSDLYETPNLDRLAAGGMKFTQAYAACTVCSPTRAAIMTGIYPARLRLTDFIPGQNRPEAQLRVPPWTKRLELKYVTIAQALRAAGYATAHVGKWHLAPPGDNPAYQPNQRGFQAQVLKPRQAKGYFLPPGFNRQGESGSDYLTDYLTDQSLEIIDRLKDRPFFLYLAYHTPHTPIQGRADLVARFRAKVRPQATHTNPSYAAMVANLDESVGRIVKRLRRHGIDKRTLIIFTSDNGGLTQRNGKHDGFTENLPLRRGKGSAYEGGVRVPLIVSGPTVDAAGSVCEQPVISMDFYPTLLEVTGASGDAEHHHALDGVSLTRWLKDPQSNLDRNLYWHYPHYHAGGDGPYSAVRSGRWRLVEFHEDQRLELFNLLTDPGETTNVADANPGQRNQLRDQLHAWRKSVDAQMPTSNPRAAGSCWKSEDAADTCEPTN